MKKLFALPLAAFVFAACSESTAPEAIADRTPSYAKPGTTPTGPTPATGTDYSHTYLFNGAIEAASANWGVDTDDGSAASAGDVINYPPADLSNGFIGRYNNTNTRARLVLTDAGSKYTINFDLYVIGSWDGRGKQAQSGTFQANVFQVAYQCTPGVAVTPIFTTTFSNQYTVQQDFPLSYLNGGNKAGTGSVAGSIDALGYKDRPDLSNTPLFRSFGDATYRLSYTLGNVCNGAAPTFVFSSTAPGQQSNIDESWGLDNVTLLVDT